MFTLKDKVLIVTGAGSGMGRELTLQLIRKGVYIAACDINATTLAETASLVSAPELIKTYELDVANPEQVAALPRTVKQDFGRLHGVINNAGIIQPFVKFAELSPKTIDRVMNINFYGVVDLTRAVLQELDPTQIPTSSTYHLWVVSSLSQVKRCTEPAKQPSNFSSKPYTAKSEAQRSTCPSSSSAQLPRISAQISATMLRAKSPRPKKARNTRRPLLTSQRA